MRLSVAAFTETQARADALRAAAADHRLRKSVLRLENGGLAAAASRLPAMDSPQLLVLETTLGGEALIAALEPLAAVVAPDTKVLILGAVNDIALYRRLLGLGVSDYLVGPQDGSALVEAITAIFQAIGGEPAGRLIAVYGAAGGVGASAVAANLAHALGPATGQAVALVDLDLWFGTAALALNQQPRQTVAEVLAQPDRIDAVLLDRFMLKVNDRLSVLPAPAQPGAVGPVDAQAVATLLTTLRQDTPVVVVDLPRLWTPWVRDILLEASELVLVAYPDLINLRNATAILGQVGEARGIGAPNRLVFSKPGLDKRSELTAKDFEDALKLAPVATVPFDPAAFGLALINGEPLAKAAPASPAVKALEALARVVAGPLAAKPTGSAAKGGLLARLLGKG